MYKNINEIANNAYLKRVLLVIIFLCSGGGSQLYAASCNGLVQPVNLSVVENTGTAVTLKWDPVEGASNYKLISYVIDRYKKVNSTTPQATFSNLPAGYYYFAVTAHNSCGDQSPQSEWFPVDVTGQSQCTLPEVPQQLASSNITGSGFTVNWRNVTNADSYQVQSHGASGWQDYASTASNFHNLTGLSAGTHYVRVNATNRCGTSSYSDYIAVEIREQSCPGQLDTPVNLRLSNLTHSGFDASWSAASGAKNYQVQLATGGQWQRLPLQTQLSKSFSNLSAGSYQVKVAAVCGNTFSAETAPQEIVVKENSTTTPSCNLPDVDGGVTISKLRENDRITSVSFSDYIFVRNLSSNYSMKITCSGKYGVATRARDDAPYYLGFQYEYTHLDTRADNTEQIQFEVTSNGRVSRKTLSWPISVPEISHPVQPSCSDINIDNDKDGIPDCAEEPGKTFFGMPVYEWGARKNIPDIFIEVDYMSKESSADLGTEPRREAFDKVKQIFSAHGYSIHFDSGSLYGQGPENYNLGGGEAVRYSPWIGLSDWRNKFDGNHDVPGMKNSDTYPGVFSYMPVYFDNRPERARLFYYALFASSQAAGGQGSSGQAPDYFDQYFYVSLGRNNWNFSVDTVAEKNRLINSQASLIMHEFGHILGLSHGGWPDKYPNYEPNNKPNYTSIMNYSYALSGVPHNKSGNEGEMISDRHFANARWDKQPDCRQLLDDKYGSGSGRRNIPGGLTEDWKTFNLDYSYGSHADFSESSYNEASVLEGQDFNCNGSVENFTSSYDLNYDSKQSKMRDYDDWRNIYIYFRSLNYTSDGKFLAQPNSTAVYANEPADVVPGAIASPSAASSSINPLFEQSILSTNKNDRPIGVPEKSMAPEK